jgi:1-acyl-sn-glycerol-3-phosphate acyltransferase
MIAQTFCQRLLRLMGWKWEAKVPELDKSVLMVAPHTSNWDFIMGKLCYTAMGRNANFVIKEEWMKGPAGWILKKLGGIGVDRSKVQYFTDNVAELFHTHEHFNVAITPEGTRKPNPKWKKGFYHIAMKAGVPIVLVKIDYGIKTVSLFHIFYPTGNEKVDIEAIQEMYRGVTGKHPKNFVLPEKKIVP